jgi:hypothetical protein
MRGGLFYSHMNLGTLAYTITATTAPLNQELGKAQQEMRKTDTSMKDAGKSIADSSKKMSGTAGANIGDLQSGLSSVSPAAAQAVGGFQKMSMAARAFQAALGPIGLAIAALGLAISALTAYFTGSVEGQEKMAKIMGYISGIATYLKDRLIELGGWLVKAFQDPQQAVKDLWEIIKQNLVNRFQGMIEMVQAGWEVISNGAKGAALAIKGIFDKEAREQAKQYFVEAGKSLVDFGEAAIKAATGIDNIGDKVMKIAGDIAGKSKEVADIEARAFRLRQRTADEMVKVAALDADIAELRRIANDDQVELNQRIAAQEQAMKKVEQKNKILLSQKQEELAIQRARNAAGQSTQDDIEAERRLQVDILNLKKAQDDETRSLLRRYGTLINEVESVAKAQEKALEDERNAREAILEDIRKAQLTEIEMIRETMDAKLTAHEWTEAERARITAYYQSQIDDIVREAANREMDERERVMTMINESQMSQVELYQLRMDQMLAAHSWTEEEKAKIADYWGQKIADTEKDRIDDIQRGWENMTQVVGGAMAGMANELGNVMAGAEADFKSLAGSMLNSIGQIINGLFAKAIAGVIAGEANKGLVGLALGAVGVGALKAMWSKNVPQMAGGGIVPPGYPGDTYPALLTSGEAVIPPQKLPEMGAPRGEMRARLVGAGPDLMIYMQETERRYH